MKTLMPTLIGALALSTVTTSFAAKEVFQRSKPHVNIGTIGHVDSGKTTLTLAIGQAAGTRDEPGLSGVTIYLDSNHNGTSTGDPGSVIQEETQTGTVTQDEPALASVVVRAESEQADYSIYDFEGDGTSMNLLTGAVPLDGVVLVVDAADGPMPQTKEHILLARQLRVPVFAIYINIHSSDPPILADRSEAATRDLLDAVGYQVDLIPAIRGSAAGAWNDNPEDILSLADLFDALDGMVTKR